MFHLGAITITFYHFCRLLLFPSKHCRAPHIELLRVIKCAYDTSSITIVHKAPCSYMVLK
uniref:Uncharacterized protein n=1 Tax=Manihot esculenta TaxID=3983 RepID=A0A2C9U582_MANES